MEEYKKVEAYHQQLKTTNLKNFQDRPDPISEVRCVKAGSDILEIEWNEPISNNSPIQSYFVFRSEYTVTSGVSVEGFNDQGSKAFTKVGETTEKSFVIKDLAKGCGYYVYVTAVNQIGEGYKPKVLPLLMTTPFDLVDDACDLYVWGNNQSSELGILDEQAESQGELYKKHHMKRPVKNLTFKSGGIMQVAPGNATALLVYSEKESSEVCLLQTGLTFMQDEKHKNPDKWLYHQEEVSQL